MRIYALLALLVFLAPALAVCNCDSKTIICWTFDNVDIIGGLSWDRCGGETNGTLTAGVATGVTGKFGEAYNFTGAGSAPDAAADAVYNAASTEPDRTGLQAQSWAYWFKPKAAPATTSVTACPAVDNTNNNQQTALVPALTLSCNTADGDIASYASVVAAGLNSWTHLACVWNPANTTISMYINGTWVGSGSNVLTTGNLYTVNSRYVAGAQWVQSLGTFRYGFNGLIDSYQYFNATLTPTEVSNLYTYDNLTGAASACDFTPLYAPVNESWDYTGSYSGAVPTAWYWNFTYNAVEYFTDTGQNTTQTLNLTGTNWEGRLTCTQGGVNSTTTHNITVAERPEANFTITSGTPLMIADSIQFNDTSTSPGGYVPMSAWYWDFDDTNTSAVQNATNTFIIPGYYNVCLIVTDSLGLNSSAAYCSNTTINGFALDVFDEKTAAAITNWNVTIHNSTYSGSFTLQNNTFTWANYSGIATGLITIDVSATGYVQRTYYGRYQDGYFIDLDAYLLDSYSGVYPIFNVVDGSINPLEDVLIAAYRSISGSSTLVAQKYTDVVGSAMLYLDPLATYTIVATKSGYSPYSGSITPISTNYLIILEALAANQTFFTSNDTFFIVVQPYDTVLNVGIDNVTVTVHDPYNNLNYWNCTVTNATGSTCASYNSTSSGGGIWTVNSSTFACTITNGTNIHYQVYYSRNTSSIHNFTGLWHTDGYSNFTAAFIFGNMPLDDSYKEFVSIAATILVGLGTGSVLGLGVGVAVIAMAATASVFTWAGWLPVGWLAIAILFALGGYAYSVRGSGGVS